MAKQSKRHMGLEVQGDLVTSNSLMFRNVLINGNFDIWQRGTSGTSNGAAGTYPATDRWRAFGLEDGVSTARCVLAQSGDVPSGSRFSASVSSNAAGTDRIGILQYVESVNCYQLTGKEATVSVKLKKRALYNADTPVKIELYYLNSTDTACTNIVDAMTGATLIASYDHTLTTDGWETATLTTTIPTQGAQGLAVRIAYIRNNMGSGEVFSVAQVQLEAGSKATAFERRSFQQELSLCQRYFEKSYNLDVPPGTNVSAGANVCSLTSSVSSLSRLFFNVRYAVPKRTTAVMGSSVTPIKIYSEDGTLNAVSVYNASATKLTVTSVANSSFNSLGNFMNMSTNATSGQAYFFHWTADAEL